MDIKELSNEITIKVNVQPRAAKNEIAGYHGDALRVRLTAPPVEGEANEACIKFFAALCGISKGQVEIISGHKARNKTVKLRGVSKAGFCALLKSKGLDEEK